MLKYEVRLGKDNFKKEKLVWGEKYLSPDLSVITGVTSPEYHLEKFNTLEATNSIINSDGAVHVECKNVQRQGFIVLKEKEYETFTGKTIDYSSDKNGKEIEYSYIVNNDKYFYWGHIPNTTNVFGYSINNLLNMVENSNGYDIFETINVPCGKNDNPIKIDTLYWIEDGCVTIDGHQYIYDRNEGDNGILKFGENGNALDITAITKCKSVEFYPYESSNDYEEVTKFKLIKQLEITKDFEKITFSKYYYYIKYKEHYCQIKKKGDGSSFSFVCEIPKYVLSGGTEEKNLEPIEFDVYFSEEENDVDSYRAAREAGNKIDSSKYDKHNVKNLEELVNVIAFVYVKDDDSYFTVEHDILNANAGNMIAVYLEDEHAPLKIGNKIKLVDNGSGNHESLIYDSGLYDGVSGDIYATYNGNKYKVKPNICDKVIINENEYDIDYINGKVADKDCIVIISGERVPMKIIDDSIDGGKLERYGKIVSGNTPQQSKIAIAATYDIKTYSGITINGKDYIIYDREDLNGNITHYAALDLSPQYVFVIKEIVGSSMYLCKPEINDTDFTDEFDRYLSELICKDVVDNQDTYELFIQNKIFGEAEITKDLAFKMTETPISSDDFYNVFDDISILVNTFYIHIPVSLRMDVANNTMQQDITTRDFFEAEKKKAINPIVDMEKDIYVPKFIDNSDEIKKGNVKGEDRYKYVGSKTTFKPIYKINVNFHFRTRNLDSWKVNDGYNNIDYAADNADNTNSNDNWFITDFYPYREILNTKRDPSEKPPEGRLRNFEWKERVNMLQETSDLMGLLYFTDDDIFYQRSKVAKSFARLSFYDSTDPQTQSLLATSCIFVDEHKLFKTFIDNSRKNNYEYGAFAEPEYEKDESGFTNPSPEYLSGTTSIHSNQKNDITELHKYNKISIYTEFLGGKKLNREKKIPYSSVTEDSYNIILDESRRISSRLVVDNKHTTDTSSEGFYIYMFREYAENLHPKPIYMKVEFNHAGIGKMIPFLIPMHWSGNTVDTSSVKYNKMYPDHALKLSGETINSITNLNDLQELKRGIPLTYTYAQTYIPLYAVYDFKNKEYGYVFDSRYVEADCNGVLNLNLFEMKVMNEEETPTEQQLKDIKLNRQQRAIINVNEKQFDRRYFKYRME